MDHVTTPVTSSVMLDRSVADVTDSSVVTGNAVQRLDHNNLVHILRSDSTAQLVMEKPAAIESSQVAAAAAANHLPSILSLSSFTASSVDNNNVSINCSFTNSSMDSQDDDAYALHVTFDEDNRPQLKPRDASQMIAGMEFLRDTCPTEKPASTEGTPVASTVVQEGSRVTRNTSCPPEVVSSLACNVSSVLFDADEPPRTLSSVMSADGRGSFVTADCGLSITTPPQSGITGDSPLPNGSQIGDQVEQRGTELSTDRDQTSAGELSTAVDDGLLPDKKNRELCNSGEVTASHAADAKSFLASTKTDHPLTPPASDGKSSQTHDSSSAGPEVEPCSSPSSKSSPASATVTPVRKSVRTPRNPLNRSEFVSLDLSPRRRTKATSASNRLSLDNCNTATTGTRSLPVVQPPLSSKSRKDVPRTKKRSSSAVASDDKCSNLEQLPVKSDPKSANIVTTCESGEMKRKRGRPRKNQTVVNGKTNVQLAAGGSWSALNSKAVGDSSLGSIGLVSELFSVTSFTPVSSQLSAHASSDSVVAKECSTPVHVPDSQSVPAKRQSPVADLSFSFSPLDELSCLDQKHKKKKKKRKRKKKSRHSSLVDVSRGDVKVVDNLDGLTEELQKVQLSSADVTHQPLQHSDRSSLDSYRVLANIFAHACHSQNVSAVQRSFVVRGKASGGTGTNLPSVIGNRSKTGRKASPSVSDVTDTETKQSCLPPKKRHKLHMAHSIAQSADVGRGQGSGRGRRGRPPKLHAGQLHRQKPHLKTSRSCSMLLLFSISLLSCCIYTNFTLRNERASLGLKA